FPVQRADGPCDALCLISFRSHAPAASSPFLAPRPITPAGTDAATQTPGWHSLRAPAPPWPPTHRALTSPRRSVASPPPLCPLEPSSFTTPTSPTRPEPYAYEPSLART